MARWPSFFPAAVAIALFTAPTASPAQSDREPVALATLVAATRSCREASTDPGVALGQIRSQRWQPSDGGLPARLRAMLPIPIFERDRVLLFFIEPAMGGPGECRITASVTGAPAWAEIVAALSADFGRQPGASTDSSADWDLPNRSADARIDRGVVHVQFSIAVPQPRPAAPPPADSETPQPATPQPDAEAKPPADDNSSGEEAKPEADQTPAAAPAPRPAGRDSEEASTAPSSSPAEIASAATACMAAATSRNVDAGIIRSAGWGSVSERGGVRVFSRDGSNVRIFVAPAGQCVIDAYGERRDSFDAIRDAIHASLTGRFGAEAAMGEAIGSPGSFSRGQGFTVGNRIGVLSSEQRDGGLSIRFTVMSMR